MCGRMFANLNLERIAQELPFENIQNNVGEPQFRNFNMRPMGKGIVMDKQRRLIKKRWSVSLNDRFVINARIESHGAKQIFYNFSRCLIIVSGYYEWSPEKLPFAFGNKDNYIVLAGIYNEQGFLVMTMPADKEMRAVHERMPVILKRDVDLKGWMGSSNIERVIDEFIVNRETEKVIRFYKVSTYVNGKNNNSETCVLSLEEYRKKYGVMSLFGAIKDKKKEDEVENGKTGKEDTEKMSSTKQENVKKMSSRKKEVVKEMSSIKKESVKEMNSIKKESVKEVSSTKKESAQKLSSIKKKWKEESQTKVKQAKSSRKKSHISFREYFSERLREEDKNKPKNIDIRVIKKKHI